MAEQFALQDKDVLVLLTDMTNFADAMKEIAITQEQVPSNRGYPGDCIRSLPPAMKRRWILPIPARLPFWPSPPCPAMT